MRSPRSKPAAAATRRSTTPGSAASTEKRASRTSGLQGPICADCHRPHEVTPASSAHAQRHLPHLPRGRARGARRLAAEQPRHLAVVACAACHAPEAKRKVDLRFYDASGKNEVIGGYGELQPGMPLDEKRLWALMHGAGGKVRLVGRVEVASADQAHAMADSGQALKECTTCHRKGAEAFQNVTVSVVGPDGKRALRGAKGGAQRADLGRHGARLLRHRRHARRRARRCCFSCSPAAWRHRFTSCYAGSTRRKAPNGKDLH